MIEAYIYGQPEDLAPILQPITHTLEQNYNALPSHVRTRVTALRMMASRALESRGKELVVFNQTEFDKGAEEQKALQLLASQELRAFRTFHGSLAEHDLETFMEIPKGGRARKLKEKALLDAKGSAKIKAAMDALGTIEPSEYTRSLEENFWSDAQESVSSDLPARVKYIYSKLGAVGVRRAIAHLTVSLPEWNFFKDDQQFISDVTALVLETQDSMQCLRRAYETPNEPFARAMNEQVITLLAMVVPEQTWWQRLPAVALNALSVLRVPKGLFAFGSPETVRAGLLLRTKPGHSDIIDTIMDQRGASKRVVYVNPFQPITPAYQQKDESTESMFVPGAITVDTAVALEGGSQLIHRHKPGVVTYTPGPLWMRPTRLRTHCEAWMVAHASFSA